MTLKQGTKVKVEYTGKLDDGTVFDSTEKHGKPLEFEIGKKQIIPGFEKTVVEMKKGEEKEIKLEPSQAYGDRNPQLVKKIPKEQLPQGQEARKGMMLAIKLPNEQQLPARIIDVSDKDVTLDLNHPLAGKNLNFKVRLVEVAEASES